MAETKRRARGEDSIFYDRSRNRWAGTITVGWETGWTPGPDHRARQDQDRGQGQTALQAPGTCSGRPGSRQVHRRAVPEGLAGDPEHAGRAP